MPQSTAEFIVDAGRFVTGVASGAITLFTPRYIAETAPSRVRGAVGSLSQVNAAPHVRGASDLKFC